MCIIAYVPQNITISDETVKIMFKRNPDGAGIMWKVNNTAPVHILKGFMDVNSLLQAWHQIPVSAEKAIHCRIATSGKISIDCCHPFPIRKRPNDMVAAKDETGLALMHNGTIGYCEPDMGMNSPYSDSMLFAANILYPLRKQLDNPAIQKLIKGSTISRLLIFRSGAKTLMFGDWKTDNGVFYSNETYKEVQTPYWAAYLNGYDYEYGYNYGYDKPYKYTYSYTYGGKKSTKKANTAAKAVKEGAKAENNTGKAEKPHKEWIQFQLPRNAAIDSYDAEDVLFYALERQGITVDDTCSIGVDENSWAICALIENCPKDLKSVDGYVVADRWEDKVDKEAEK